MKLVNTYQNLPAQLYRKILPRSVNTPKLVIVNDKLAKALKIDVSDEHKLANWFSGNLLIDGSVPIAQAYAGHQFGQLNILGDGRAVLLGEAKDKVGRLIDIQLKGSGVTPFSRNGDGKASMSAMLREYLISEAMHALQIPTTRSLAVVTTGENIIRQSLEQGAILTRTAASHIRVGTFVYAKIQTSQLKDNNLLQALLDYSINRHYPQFKTLNTTDKALSLLEVVMDKQAQLIAHWSRVGFIHGVLNTDNVTISGEGIDYGPCAFMDTYNPKTVYSSIDYQGRYAFKNQMPISWWNMARFAESLLPLIDNDEDTAIKLATNRINTFDEKFKKHWHAMLCAKIGLNTTDKNVRLAKTLLELMHAHQLDYTNSFKQLTLMVMDIDFSDIEALEFAKISDTDAFDKWIDNWKKALKKTDKLNALMLMQTHNPLFIPRNHLVESALQQAKNNDLTEFKQLLKALQTPYDWGLYKNTKALQQPATKEWNAQFKTFCGT
ncbi:MAG: hypothetical protein CSA42_06725 [Gammaproteobacteria bacterium]|nr:MAG: hypothetical protein CSA42_06725 [Gammaproteobacteria bacterium]